MSEENTGIEIPGEAEEWAPDGQAEERAAGQGWQPEHLFEGDPDTWVDAPEFNVRGELMGKIQGMGRKLSGYEKEIAELREVQKRHSDMTKSMVESTYKKALADIKRDKREAMELGDYDAVDDLDERAEAIRGKSKELEAIEEPAAPAQFDPATAHPIERAFVDIVATTPALRADPDKVKELSHFADALWADKPDISTLEFNAAIAKELNGAPRSVPGPGGAGQRRAPKGPKSRYSKSDLSDMEVEFAKTFVETGAYKSIQAYIDDAAKSNSLEIQQR
jgi:hypothetical protein